MTSKEDLMNHPVDAARFIWDKVSDLGVVELATPDEMGPKAVA